MPHYVVGLTLTPTPTPSANSLHATLETLSGAAAAFTPPVQVLASKSLDDVLLLECTVPLSDDDAMVSLFESLSYVSEAEIYVTAPCRVPIGTWTTDSLVAREDRGETVDAFFERTGVLVYKEAIPIERIDAVRAFVDTQIEKAHAALSKRYPAINVGEEQFAFKEIGSRGGNRFDLILQADESPLAVKQIAQEGPWVPLVRRALRLPEDGSDVPCLISVVYSLPGADAQSWHADGVPSTPPYAVCVFVPLIDLDADTGCTQFWPGSHKDKALLGFGVAAEVCGSTMDGMLKRGGGLIYDYGVLHRGLGNGSYLRRPVLQIVYHQPGWRDRKNYGDKSLFQCILPV
ncbi:uncharacterized protein EV422DRAFT_531124 [Fimicolochytrium jonesii]|uniref:uncharacterized protein n=1 Tax=Fimicolochytrium jonesii TaxID=1396493 RepID=UPI0022FE093C|nr:uncharacterized protein EV422DRAFT_531124 [Fimicolochytrium jonesii]KAI8820511.1 hypothetical protein EV422DRAFT_531124 [Fimicolochytrium jonesii]